MSSEEHIEEMRRNLNWMLHHILCEATDLLDPIYTSKPALDKIKFVSNELYRMSKKPEEVPNV
jgi:hypothetical protein